MSSDAHPFGGPAAAAAELGAELRRFRGHELRATREPAPGAFGPVGRDTGFTAALAAFATRATLSAAALSDRTLELAAELAARS